MKRIIIAFIAAMTLFPSIAEAKVIASFIMGAVTLDHDDSGYSFP